MRDKTARHEGGGPGNEGENWRAEDGRECDEIGPVLRSGPALGQGRYDEAQGSARIMQSRGDEMWPH